MEPVMCRICSSVLASRSCHSSYARRINGTYDGVFVIGKAYDAGYAVRRAEFMRDAELLDAKHSLAALRQLI